MPSRSRLPVSPVSLPPRSLPAPGPSPISEARLSGFLAVSGYEGTSVIDLGSGYHAEVKKFLSESEAGFVETAMLGKPRVEMGANKQYADIDTRASRVEMVVQSLVSWNLDDPDLTLWPLDSGIVTPPRPGVNPFPPGCPRRVSVARLPSPVFDLIWAECDKANEPRKGKDAATFPDQAVGSGTDGDTGAA